jgi:hypothetical protein
MTIAFRPLPTETVRHLQGGGADAYGHPADAFVSDGEGVPCRHCLRDVPAGARALVLAHRPFTRLHAFAETGPIFICAEPCTPAAPSAALPAILSSPDYVVRAYDGDERIVYGTGGVVGTADIPARAAALLARPDVAFVDVRSARNGCFQVRVERG